MFLRLMLVAALGLALTSGLASAGGKPTYTGASPKATHRMQIGLYLSRPRRAEWVVYMYTPCMHRSIGTDQEPILRLRHGRFSLHRVHTNQLSDIHYHYLLKGHRTPNGFAGTLNYVEIDGYHLPPPQPKTCPSTLLHWTAHPGGTFP